MNDSVLIEQDHLTFRCLLPDPPSSTRKILLLLHGWTGDENIMWIFVPQARPGTLILSPRGLVEADPTGYGWSRAPHKLETPADAYLPAARELLSSLDAWFKSNQVPALPLDVMGFSQGAAMAAVLSVHFSERVGKTALLAGFLPPGLKDELDSAQLKGKQFFISHGTRDDLVPFSKAEETVSALEAAGARVTFCPSETTHKVSLDCTRGLQAFFENNAD